MDKELPTPVPHLLNEYQAAKYITLSVAYMRINRQKKVPDPPYVKMGHKVVRYLKEDLDAWIRKYRFPRNS